MLPIITFMVTGLGMTELRNLMGTMTRQTSLTRNLLTRWWGPIISRMCGLPGILGLIRPT